MLKYMTIDCLTTEQYTNKFLTDPCPWCRCSGKVIARVSWMDKTTCYNCKGVGYLPNEEGEEIIKMVKLHLSGGKLI